MKIEKKALKALRKMPQKTADRFMAAFADIEAGQDTAYDITPMKGDHKGYFRLRIGDYRAIYTRDMEIIVITAGPRGDIYKH